MSAHTASDQK